MSSRRALKVERVEKKVPELLIYRLSGDLTDRRECYDFLEELRGECQDGCPYVVINLEQVGFISSSGVGILAATFTSAKNAGGRVCIVGVSERGRTLLEIGGLWTVIDHHAPESEALEAAKG